MILNSSLFIDLSNSSCPAPNELASYHKKLAKIDDHCGVAFSGLHADGRALCKFMREECMTHRFRFGSSLPLSRLSMKVANRAQKQTQWIGGRPLGVGLLIIGTDSNGAHLLEATPTGNAFLYEAQALGARSQSAKTYLERVVGEDGTGFHDMNAEQLMHHALMALKETSSEKKLTSENTACALLGLGMPFKELNGEEKQVFLDALEQ